MLEYNGNIMVSIVCNTYNHEGYIGQALEGFVMQKTNFVFEILVHDDASTDKTADIIRSYEKRYPDLIKPIYETENQYSKHDGSLWRIQYGRVKGKYIAFCEGDDYWTDPLKLQKQVDAMERNPQVDMCAHKAKWMDGRTNRKTKSFPPINETRILTPEEVIYGEGDFLATNSLLYRSAINRAMPRFREFWNVDYTLQIYGSLRGGILFLEDEMSAYRYMTRGSWTASMCDNVDRAMELQVKKQKMLDILNEDTKGQYAEVISRRKRKNEWLILDATNQNREMLRDQEFVRELPVKEKVKLYGKAWFPWLRTLKREIAKRI